VASASVAYGISDGGVRGEMWTRMRNRVEG
jgi:hypothetical protein